ncbi:unnamed protein product [Rotaria sp. Silwood2]|nr:unnamed protein product [Rotaria sp. Silwood2]CAF4507833.1 unnamed protein product [Rotaria sp. Silwood2]
MSRNDNTTTRNIQTSNDNTSTINTSNHEEVQVLTVNTDEQTPSPNTNYSVSTNESEAVTPIECPPPSNTNSNRITLDKLSSLESINDLTIRQLKEILENNFVSIVGCVEKKEVLNKVELLYRDRKQQKEPNTSVPSEQSDENLCKVCMDAPIDCVFLNCGHLCTCVDCSQQFSECPLCRSFIIRAVRVFKG